MLRKNPEGDFPRIKNKGSYIDPTAVIMGRVKTYKEQMAGEVEARNRKLKEG